MICTKKCHKHTDDLLKIELLRDGSFKLKGGGIRESADSLYRDDTDEISRDPRTKRPVRITP